VYFFLVVMCLVVSNGATVCLERLVSKMTYIVLLSLITPHGQHTQNIHSIIHTYIKTDTAYKTLKNNRQVLLLKFN